MAEDGKQRSDDRRLKPKAGIWKSERLEGECQVLFFSQSTI